MNFHGKPREVILVAQRHLIAQNRLQLPQMAPVDRAAWPQEFFDARAFAVGVWRSRRHLAVAYQEGPFVRLSVLVTVLRDDGHWVDGITWDDLQRIKRECGYGDVEAVEIYPPDGDVVNVANLRHLWLLTSPMPMTWRRDGVR